MFDIRIIQLIILKIDLFIKPIRTGHYGTLIVDVYKLFD